MDLAYFQQFIGKSSKPVKNEVEKGAIRKFAQAIGDPNPLYRDEEAASQSRFGRLVAPPTFSRTFDYGAIEGLEFPHAGLIHGEQSFEYVKPLLAGDVVYCTTTLVDAFEKHGKLGRMIFLVFEQRVMDEAGDLVQKARSVVIYRGQEGGA
ncbi:MAG: MaoC family dehydratase N-terminal domain-containing protein [Thermoflavifilum sp.]|nr:MaoC family dehydratase N-terminal domain-containing protein [Thermoflavifilum sp.]MCL6513589.1 MaoC family dehydratase N-terminal domain-containing protein [Alicyclobacillus sp.]